MITRDQKKEIIKDLVDKLSRQKAAIFFDYTGLTVNQFQELRNRLREEKLDCRATKKTMVRLALEKTGFKNINVKELPGQIALAFSYDDEILPARILYNFSKDNQALKILSGLIQGAYLENEAIIDLAKLPSKDELLARLVGSLAAPIRGFASVLQGNLRKLVFILKGLKLET